MSDSLSSVNRMVSDLNASLTKAIAGAKAKQAAAPAASGGPTGEVTDYQKTVRKAGSDSRMFATDIGVLSKGVSRLNVVSTLAANDTVDFYKFRVTTRGEATIGQIGDQGVRVQLMSKTGAVVADSEKTAGTAYQSFRDLQRGRLTIDRGDYTLRVSRDKDQSGKDQPGKDPKNYAVQVSMGGYSKDYDTIAKEPRKGDSPFQMTDQQQVMLAGLNAAIGGLNAIRSGQTGTQKLAASLDLRA
ncbi:hypothetical protein [Azospirillum sp. TSO35-2]|uniref:hypothetical protein n=1 Tax=Azospirillum sp. TSO35-2 TaxID=716796 RepID=UPI000D605E08|nr:hypothetical protein [Azospirillum sp. TSO35-2]PWC39208.1 hypothetical protein TSO352_03100 [Azospirillum sp. TSO35-2]